MIYEMLKAESRPVFLGGNFAGISTINFLKQANKESILVAELSSWALSGFHREKISPHIAVFTNFYPDHLNYYRNLDEYLDDKKAIYLYQKKGDYLIANKNLQAVIEKDQPKSNVIYFQANDFKEKLIYLYGQHNQENAAASIQVGRILNVDFNKMVNSLKSFNGLFGRQQIIAQKNNLIVINDTTSTTPTATIKALETFSDKPIILILGGNKKNLPYDQLIRQLQQVPIKKIFLLQGSFTDQILPDLKKICPEKISKKIYDDLEKAVKEALKLAKNINQEFYLLFSPAATSFSMFKNEFDRGEKFNQIVYQLIKNY